MGGFRCSQNPLEGMEDVHWRQTDLQQGPGHCFPQTRTLRKPEGSHRGVVSSLLTFKKSHFVVSCSVALSRWLLKSAPKP